MKLFEQRSTRRQFSSRLTAAAAGLLVPSFARLCAGEEPLIHIAICTTTIAGANISDARAAYLVWLREIARFYGKRTADTDPEVFISPDELIRGVRSGSIDGFGATALELEKLVDITEPDAVVIQDYMAGGMEYVLLVHNSSPFKKVADLRGARIASHLHRDMVLLPAWLGTMLAANNLPQAEQFFASHQLIGNLNQVILPLFFRRVDGVCIARRSWETAVELNPQLGRDLRAVAVSPTVIPIIFAFRNSTIASARKSLIDSIQRIYAATTGQQIIALYQSSGVVVKPISVMKSTIEMVRQFERLPAQQAHTRKGAS